MNLLRDPRWGRNEEGYAEDPLLTARLADVFCRGLAGDDPDHLRTAPILKHFLAYNNEDERCVTSSGLRPRVLHEYDLAAFRTAVAAGFRDRGDARLQPGQRPPLPRESADRGGTAALGRTDRARAVRLQRRRGPLQPGRPRALLRGPRRVARRRPAGRLSTASPTTPTTRAPPSPGSPRPWPAACSPRPTSTGPSAAS